MKTFYEISDWEISDGVYTKTRRIKCPIIVKLTVDIKWLFQRAENLSKNGVIPKINTSNNSY